MDRNSAEDFTDAFIQFMELVDQDPERQNEGNYENKMVLDCANGVGTIPMRLVTSQIRRYIDIQLVNTHTDHAEPLNENCGAEYVHKEGKLPTDINASSPKKAASFDGDADRLMYFKNLGEKPVIIDGDKQFALLMLYVVGLLKKLGIENRVSHCIVNTAYANSKAIQFSQSNGINTVLVPTGVKHAHPVVQTYDIGANDEPNGHGTICYKMSQLNAILDSLENPQCLDARKLRAFLRISNIYVGDAIANLLTIEAVLRDKDSSIDTFSSMYWEQPSKMYKAVVSNRNNFKTQWDESRLTEPKALQDAIDRFSN